jgi:hypothetical protein
MRFALDVVIFINDFVTYILQAKPNNHAMHSGLTACFVAPAKGAVREMNLDTLRQHPAPEFANLLDLGDAVSGNKGTAYTPLYASFSWTRLCFLLVNLIWFGTTVRLTLGTPSPWGSKERRAGFSLTTRTVAWANKPAFLQGWVP